MSRRTFLNWLFTVPGALVIVLLTYLLLRPDPAASQFYRAQRLQLAGQDQYALRIYNVIVQTQPHSSFAPRALQQKGEILTSLARQTGDAKLFRQAIDAYAQLIADYPSHSTSGEALLTAGGLALNDLRDTKAAARFYQTLLDNYGGNADYVSEATLRLGRIALQEGDGARAQSFFTRVLKEHTRFPDRCAEAQYHLGVAFETLLKNRPSARGAYEATIKKWPRSVWASDAKERLGMLFYSGLSAPRAARRVLLQVGAAPQLTGDSRAAALRMILAARGVEISDAVWRGWSLAPFRAGFTPTAPGRVLDTDEKWETVAAHAGLVYTRRASREVAVALNLLRDELDDGHAVVANIENWSLVVGYDSARDEIFLQNGSERRALKSKEFARLWRDGGEYSLWSFHAPGEQIKPLVEKPKADADAPALNAPLYLYKLPNLSIRNAHRRALRGAARQMQQSRDGRVLLNGEALRALQRELEKLAIAPESPIPQAESPAGEADDESASPEAESTPAPQATPVAPSPRADLARTAARWKSLRPWFATPLQHWVSQRGDAAAFLDIAANDLNSAALRRAAEQLRTARTALENAATSIPEANAFEEDADAARAALQTAANYLRQAREAESRALNDLQ